MSRTAAVLAVLKYLFGHLVVAIELMPMALMMVK